jgi:1,2-phenylacetyl-CoA epoxidase PaaB subunit
MACRRCADQTSRLAMAQLTALDRGPDRRTIWVMERSAIESACSLSEPELREQLARYATAGRGGEVLERDRRRRVIRVGSDVPESLILRLIEIERRCCPFFDMAWDGASRRLAIDVKDSDHEPALEAIVYALGAATD